MKSLVVSQALNHAAYTFDRFCRQDWVDMARVCLDRASSMTCQDCGAECSPGSPAIPGVNHVARDGRWACHKRTP